MSGAGASSARHSAGWSPPGLGSGHPRDRGRGTPGIGIGVGAPLGSGSAAAGDASSLAAELLLPRMVSAGRSLCSNSGRSRCGSRSPDLPGAAR